MTEQIKLRNQVLESLTDLRNRFSSLSNDDIAADIINVICKYIIENNTLNYKASPQPMIYFQINWSQCSAFVSEVIISLRNDLNGIITEQTCQALTQNICLNLGWSEMPTFLDNYFSTKHNKNNDRESFDFMSTRHERYENSVLVSSSKVDRNIRISCWNNQRNMSIEINPTLSLKRASLKSVSQDVYTYMGEDPDYIFEVSFDDFEEVDYVSVSLKSRDLKLVFY